MRDLQCTALIRANNAVMMATVKGRVLCGLLVFQSVIKIIFWVHYGPPQFSPGEHDPHISASHCKDCSQVHTQITSVSQKVVKTMKTIKTKSGVFFFLLAVTNGMTHKTGSYF